jgi:hypothetical protein
VGCFGFQKPEAARSSVSFVACDDSYYGDPTGRDLVDKAGAFA